MARIRISDKEDGHLAFDLAELLEILGDAAVESNWQCSVDDFVPRDFARYLPVAYRLAENGIPGSLLWQLATNTLQVIDGTFAAFRPNEDKPWITLVAFDSSWWEIDASRGELLWPFRARFSQVEDVT